MAPGKSGGSDRAGLDSFFADLSQIRIASGNASRFGSPERDVRGVPASRLGLLKFCGTKENSELPNDACPRFAGMACWSVRLSLVRIANGVKSATLNVQGHQREQCRPAPPDLSTLPPEDKTCMDQDCQARGDGGRRDGKRHCLIRHDHAVLQQHEENAVARRMEELAERDGRIGSRVQGIFARRMNAGARRRGLIGPILLLTGFEKIRRLESLSKIF